MKLKQSIMILSLALGSAAANAVQTSRCPENFSVNLQNLSVYSRELITENSVVGLERNLIARDRLLEEVPHGLQFSVLKLDRVATGRCYYSDGLGKVGGRLFTKNGNDTLMLGFELDDSSLKSYVNVSSYSKEEGLETDEVAKIYNVVYDREAEVLTQIAKAREVLFVGEFGLAINCSSSAESDSKSKLHITSQENTFDLKAFSEDGQEIFNVADQRPSLNARIEDGESTVVNEFVDFNDKGLETIPVDGKKKLEIDLGPSPLILTYAKDELTKLQLKCDISRRKLVGFLGIKPLKEKTFEGTQAVAFDIDDTLLFSSPTFTRAFASGGLPKPTDVLFWTHANACDGGCAEESITLPDGIVKVLPANAPSTPKTKAIELIKYHKSLGHKVYAITARPDINGEPLRDYLVSAMGFDRENIYFEPEIDQPGNPIGKTDRIESLNLDIFYGDSDSDITDTLKAFVDPETGLRSKKVEAVRFFRSPKSSNRKAGELNKYHPGYFGEPIIAGSY